MLSKKKILTLLPFFTTTMKQLISNFKTKFPQKNILLLTGSFLLIGTLLLAGGAFGRFGSSSYEKTLAGEKVPFDKAHQFNIERLDRELAVNQMNEAQMKIIWKRLPYFKPYIDQKLREN